MKISMFILIFGIAFSSAANAKGSIQHFTEMSKHSLNASKHSVKAIGNGIVGSGKVVSAVVATPLLVTGVVLKSVGKVGEDAGSALMEDALGTKLPVTDKTITVDPSPDLALNNPQEQ